jgi:hypothetical protein
VVSRFRVNTHPAPATHTRKPDTTGYPTSSATRWKNRGEL